MHRRISHLLWMAFFAVLASSGEDATAPDSLPISLTVVSGGDQSGAVGTELPRLWR